MNKWFHIYNYITMSPPLLEKTNQNKNFVVKNENSDCSVCLRRFQNSHVCLVMLYFCIFYVL